MSERYEPDSTGERKLRSLVSSALAPAAPPLPDGLPAELAGRARTSLPARIDVPLVAAGFSAVGMMLLAVMPLLPVGRMDLRWLTAAVPAANLMLSPLAAFVVIRKIQKEAPDAET